MFLFNLFINQTEIRRKLRVYNKKRLERGCSYSTLLLSDLFLLMAHQNHRRFSHHLL
ncbi:unnamed protein product [Brassica oleracea]